MGASSGMPLRAADRCRLPGRPNAVCLLLRSRVERASAFSTVECRSGGGPDMGVSLASVTPPADVDSVTRSWLLRAKGMVLVAVMLSGGGALPVLDALLY